MSDLHKQVLKNQSKQKPPQSKNFQDENSDDSDEEKDQFNANPNDQPIPVKLQGQKPQPIKADHHLPQSHHQNPSQNKMTSKKIHDYSPLKWNNFFDELIYHPNGTSIYISGQLKAPIFFCLHGAGHSAMSFANLATEIKQYATLISFDYRGHGLSKFDNETVTLDTQTLINDTIEILNYVSNIYSKQTFILVGHSMGGAIATKVAEVLSLQNKFDKLQGLVVIDVVEGSAIEALPFMEQIINNRPKSFKSYEQAIQWSLNSSTLMTLASARISIPYQLTETKDENGQLVRLDWRVDLLKTHIYWQGWFEGLTNSFLNIRIPKILMLAEKERLDKDLTVAQMQGKFRLIILQNTGHSMQEDDPKSTAYNFHDFLVKFRIPTTVDELNKLKQIGIGKFHPFVENYEYKEKYY